MYKQKRILAVIPARGGSKGVPRKNIRVVAGKPLIAWTIEESKKSRYIDRTIVSSDDKGILRVCRKFGCDAPFIRPSSLAQDNVPARAPVMHALDTIGDTFDYTVLLQPTSPLRTAKDIDGCIKKCIDQNAGSCVTVCRADKSPYWMYSLDSRCRLKPFVKSRMPVLLRQQANDLYALNGAVYVVNNAWFRKSKTFISDGTIAYPMPQDRSMDIDTETDLRICDLLLKKRER